MITTIAKARIARRKAAAAVDQFRRTGIVPKLLLMQYDQTGKFLWEGDRVNEIDRDARKLLSKITLTNDQMVEQDDRGRLILLTSYEWTHRRQAIIKWHQIRGDLYVARCPEVNAQELRSVCGLVNISDAAIDMPRLKYAGGLSVGQYTEFHLPQLVATGNLISFAKRIVLPRLECVNGDFHAYGATCVIAPRLRKVTGCLFTLSARVVFDPSIKANPWMIYHEAEARWKQNDPTKQARQEILRQALRESSSLEI